MVAHAIQNGNAYFRDSRPESQACDTPPGPASRNCFFSRQIVAFQQDSERLTQAASTSKNRLNDQLFHLSGDHYGSNPTPSLARLAVRTEDTARIVVGHGASVVLSRASAFRTHTGVAWNRTRTFAARADRTKNTIRIVMWHTAAMDLSRAAALNAGLNAGLHRNRREKAVGGTSHSGQGRHRGAALMTKSGKFNQRSSTSRTKHDATPKQSFEFKCPPPSESS